AKDGLKTALKDAGKTALKDAGKKLLHGINPRRILARHAGEMAAKDYTRAVPQTDLRRSLLHELTSSSENGLLHRLAERQIAEQPLKRGATDVGGRLAEHVAERWAAGRAAKRAGESLAEHAGERASERAAERAAERAVERTTGRAVATAADRG